MSMSGITASTPDLFNSRTESAEHSPIARRQPSAPAEPATAEAASRNTRVTTGNALPAEAPPGTDPALWSILTRDERAFFARNAGSGPLTYTKIMRTDHSVLSLGGAVRGGRIDARA